MRPDVPLLAKAHRRAASVLALCLLSFSQSLAAQTAPPPAAEPARSAPVITRDALLESARLRHPEVLASLADKAAAEGKQQAAQGAFDLFLDGESKGWLNGYYEGSAIANVGMTRRLKENGGSIYGGYRISEGSLPVYEDYGFTNNLGELRIGAVFALMRDRAIDSDRFAISDLSLAERQAAIEVLLVEIGVQRAALLAYWNWLASGQVIDVYRDLLETAEARQVALTRQFDEGAIAEIALIENRRILISRKVQLANAEQAFLLASNDLSVYWRDDEGRVRAPTQDQRPAPQVLDAADFALAENPKEMARLTRARPDLALLDLGLERARNQIALKENDLRPKLDLKVEVSRDFGRIAEGGRSGDSTDVVAGVAFSVPFGQVQARGALSAAQAELRAKQLRRQLAAEQVDLEVGNIVARLSAAFGLYTLAQDEVEVAAQLTRSERRQFESGASDLFRIIEREDDEASARINLIAAQRAALIAKTDFDAASVDVDGFGLGTTASAGHP